jgi:purine-binding chemotaxis protein CheW
MTQHSAIELAGGGAQYDHLIAGDQFIVVDLAGKPYGIPVGQVLEVEQVPNIAPVPSTREWLYGVVNMRGTILTLVDPASLLQLGAWQRTPLARLLVIDRDDPVALVVDRLRGMRRLTDPVAPEVFEELPGRVTDFVMAVYREGDGFINILDMHRLLEDADRSSQRADEVVTTAAGVRQPGGAVALQERGAQ